MRSEPLFPSTFSRVALATALAALSACTGGSTTTGTTPLECGPDTELRDGKCVSNIEPAECADGTTRDPATGECVSRVQCAPGTTYNASNGRCEGDAECGTGTVRNPQTGECVSLVSCGPNTSYDTETRTCRPDVVCGNGTALNTETGLCEPETQCGNGTYLDPVTLTCVPDLACGPRLIPLNGVCRNPADVVGGLADAVEPTLDMNDPEFGGTALGLTLEPEGEQTIFAGIIGRPVDLDGDNVIDQDRDVWEFDGAEGDVLRIRVLDNGLPQPAFILDGPNGYSRQPVVGGVLEADRHVILPYTGRYALSVIPMAVLLAGEVPAAVGSSLSGYVGVIERVSWPALRPLTPGEAPDFNETTGDARNLLENFHQLQTSAQEAVTLTATVADGPTVPVALFFNTDHKFLGVLPIDRITSGVDRYELRTGLFAEEAGNIVVVVDWLRSDGAEAPLTLAAMSLQTHAVPAAEDGRLQELDTLKQEPQQGHAFLIDADEGQVVHSLLTGLSTSTVLTLIAPDGSIVDFTDDDEHVFYAQQTGTYALVVIPSSASTNAVDLDFAVLVGTAIDGGTFSAAEGTTRSITGADLFARRRVNDRAYILVENTDAALLEFTYKTVRGNQEMLQVTELSPNGTAVSTHTLPSTTWPELDVLRDGPGRSLVTFTLESSDLREPDPPARGWTVEVTARPLPTTTEVEPNDDAATAQPLTGPLPLYAQGTLQDNSDEIDQFTFSLDSPLDADEVVLVQAQLQGTDYIYVSVSSVGMTNADGGAGALTLIDEVGTSVAPTVTLTAEHGTGPFHVELDFSGSGEDPYLLSIKRVRLPRVESEPNDDVGGAQSVTVDAYPFELYGITTTNAPDVYALTLPAAPAAGSGVIVRAEELTKASGEDLSMQLLDGSGAVLMENELQDASLLINTTSAGPHYIRVNRERTSGTPAPRLPYRLTISTLDNLETEPNNSREEAQALGTLTAGTPLQIQGEERGGANYDWYRIDLDTPLADNEIAMVRWWNETNVGDEVRVRAFDSRGLPLGENVTVRGELPLDVPAASSSIFLEVQLYTAVTTTRAVYRLSVERMAGRVEIEPNSRAVTADTLTEFPIHVQGTVAKYGHDVFALQLPRALASDEVVELRLMTSPWFTDLNVEVFDPAGNRIGSVWSSNSIVRFAAPGGAGATYLVDVEGITTGYVTGEKVGYSMLASIIQGTPNIGEIPSGGGSSSSSSGGSSSSSSSSGGMGSSSGSEPAQCTNLVVETGETCDDGNRTPGDGCDGDCQLEPGNLFEAELNDTLALATPLNITSGSIVVHGAIDPEFDVDVFSFTTTALTAISVETFDNVAGATTCNRVRPPGSSSLNDVEHDLELIAADGQLHAFDDNDGLEECARLDPLLDPQVAKLPAGTWYLRLTEDGNDDTEWYQFRFSILSVCGDDVVEGPEECEPATWSGEGVCLADCRLEVVCGNNILSPSEQCDDGNLDAGDGCDANCMNEALFCGDGSVNPPFEQCEDGNRIKGDGCDQACRAESGHYFELETAAMPGLNDTVVQAAGNVLNVPVVIHGSIDPAAEDDVFAFEVPVAADVRLEVFDGTPSLSSCAGIDPLVHLHGPDGLAVLAADDDDGVDSCPLITAATDFRAGRLLPGTYYARVFEFGRNSVIGAYQLQVTFTAVCGDGMQEGTEQCDDGNLVDDDGCESTCTLPANCGDFTQQVLEECDDGNIDVGDGCGMMCMVESASCGNSRTEAGEQCDDGGTEDGDGCDANCQVEFGADLMEVEPNDDRAAADARTIRLTGTHRVRGTLETEADEDFYRVELASNSLVRFETFDGTGTGCSGISVVVARWGTSGTSYIVRDNEETGLFGCGGLTEFLPAGTHYIQVEEDGQNSVVGEYVLQMRLLELVASELEPNDLMSQATLIPEQGVVFGSRADGELDWWKVRIPPGGHSLRVEVFEGGAKPCAGTTSTGMRPRITIYDNGNTELTNDTTGGRSSCPLVLTAASADTSDEELRKLPAGTYYISVDSTTSGNARIFDYRMHVTLE